MRYLMFVCLVITLASCASKAPKPRPASKLDAAGTAKITELLGSYYSVKNAMVKDNAEGIKTASVELNKKATDFKTFIAKDAATSAAVAANLDTIIRFSDYVAHLYPEAYVEKSRLQLGRISNNMYALLQKVELKNAGVYHEFCPMAMNDTGAYWLSEKAEIENPYFGKKMLDCGEVKDSL